MTGLERCLNKNSPAGAAFLLLPASEITYGSFHRTITLPEGVDKDKLNAEYRNGMLEITAPIAAAALPRKVEIKSLPGPATT